MPVEFLTDEEAASYGRFNGPPPRAELELGQFSSRSNYFRHGVSKDTFDYLNAFSWPRVM